jgi:nucleotide-binding universal stress UspA family protein
MNKIIVAMPLDEKLQNQIIAQVEKMSFIADADVEFVHVFLEQNYPYMMPPTFYPDQDQKVEIEKTIVTLLDKLTSKVPAKNRTFKCLFSESPKETMVDYIKDNNVDLVIADAREKKGITGFFTSSFTEYLVKHAPSRVLVLR